MTRLLLAGLLGCWVATAAAQRPPSDFLLAALRQHPVVFFGDIHPLAEPKEIVAEVIGRQDAAGGIGLLALEVGSDQQEWIDRYLASVPEDTTILLAHARTLRAHWGASHEYLGIYRAVWRWNAAHPGQPTGILAADVRSWPMAPLTEGMAVGGFVNRDVWMARAFAGAMAGDPGRTLIFMGGYHGLRNVGGEVTLGAVHERFDRWFAGYLADDGVEVYSILTDARQEEGNGATRVFDQLAPGFGQLNVAVPLDTLSDAIRQPLRDVVTDGYRLEFLPVRFPLRTAVDALVMLNTTRPITVLPGVFDRER